MIDGPPVDEKLDKGLLNSIGELPITVELPPIDKKRKPIKLEMLVNERLGADEILQRINEYGHSEYTDIFIYMNMNDKILPVKKENVYWDYWDLRQCYVTCQYFTIILVRQALLAQ